MTLSTGPLAVRRIAAATVVAIAALPLRAGPADARLAAAPAAAAGDAWRAEWIGVPAPSQPNTWVAFRRTFDVAVPPGSAVARIACDSKYWLWVNGRLVVFEGQLKRGPTREDTYYDDVDLAPYLVEGENTVAVLVWYWGPAHNFSHNGSGRAGLLFEADIGGDPLLSGPTWKARVHPAYGRTDAPHPNTLLPEPNVRFDGRQDPGGWQAAGYADDDWPAAAAFGRPPVAPWNRLIPRPIPLWRDGGLVDYESVQVLSNPAGGRIHVARLPYNAQVTPYLEVEAPAGLEIDIRTDTYTASGRTSVRSVYVTREGVQSYESLGWMSGHEVGYSIPPGVRVIALKYRETGYDADFHGRFTSDDPALNTLWEKARRTLYVTMRDNHMDCPERERALYGGDLTIELALALHALDAERGPLLARKGLLELARWRRDNGVVASPVPHQGRPREIPMQGLAALGWYGLWTYYMYTGDRETVAAAYPAVRDYLSLWRVRDDGTVAHREGEWDWADWYGDADHAVLENAWYYLAVKAAAEMAALLDRDGHAAEYRALMATLEAGFDAAFWRGDHYRSPLHIGSTDDRGNALAVVAGLARPEYYPALQELLMDRRHASPYMEKYVIEALYRMDAPVRAVERMKERWAPQVESPLTTLWEFWEWREDTPGSYNHGWAGGPLPLLSRYAAGIAPTAPAFETFAVLPRMAPLTTVDAAVPTPAGLLDVQLRRGPGEFTMRLSTPQGASGVAGVPLLGLRAERIEVNGDVVWLDGEPTSSASPVRVIGQDDRWIRLSVPAGAWDIRATGQAVAPLFAGELFNMSENPVRSRRLILTFREPPEAAGVYTLDGRRVVDLLERTTAPDRVEWDLTTGRGGRVAPGLYFLVAEVADRVVRRKLILLTPP